MNQEHATVKSQVSVAEDIRLRLAEAWGEMGAAWGVAPAIARVHAYLMARQGPLTEREVREALGLSHRAASMALAEAEAWGIVERVEVPRRVGRRGPAGTAFVNDVTVTPHAVYFTDSFQPVLYRLPLGHQGSLPSPGDIETVVLTGPAADDHTPGQFNLNGIASTLGGRALLVVNSFNGGLYSVDADTGVSERIDLGAGNLLNGDGLVLQGRQLLVVQNTQNKIAVVHLEDDLTSGRVVGEITDDRFRVPTTAADFGPFLYAVNARFDVAPPPFGGTPPSDPSLAYEVVRVLVPVIPR